jgi:hypothetical protein
MAIQISENAMGSLSGVTSRATDENPARAAVNLGQGFSLLPVYRLAPSSECAILAAPFLVRSVFCDIPSQTQQPQRLVIRRLVVAGAEGEGK